jgi:hypothetical protein
MQDALERVGSKTDDGRWLDNLDLLPKEISAFLEPDDLNRSLKIAFLQSENGIGKEHDVLPEDSTRRSDRDIDRGK